MRADARTVTCGSEVRTNDALIARMADHNSTSSDKSRTQRQNEGYDEAAHGGKNMPSTDVGVPHEPDHRSDDPFDREADQAANDVRRREHSAD